MNIEKIKLIETIVVIDEKKNDIDRKVLKDLVLNYLLPIVVLSKIAF